MKAIKTDYLTITLPYEGMKKATGVLQTCWPHLIGRVYLFNNPDSYFGVLEQLNNNNDTFVCIPDTSIVVKLEGTLKDFNENNIEGFGTYARNILHEMGMFHFNTLSEGQQKHIGERFTRKV